MTSSLTDEQLIAQGMHVAVHARRSPDRLAIMSPSGNLTWAEFNAKANQLVRVFRSQGLQVGDGVALLAHNGPEFAIVWAATQRAGLRLTAVNWHQSPELVAYVVDNSDALALVMPRVCRQAGMCRSRTRQRASGRPGLHGLERAR